MDKVAILGIAVGLSFGIFLGITLSNAKAHPPCYEQPIRQQPTCGYEQAVNPITGKLEQHYVCK